MTAEMNESNGVLECRKVELEVKNGKVAGDLSGDLSKIDCNGNLSYGGDVIEEGKGEVDGSHDFVNGGTHDHVDDAVVENDQHVEDVGDPADVVETKFVVEGENGLGVDRSVREEKQIECGGFGEGKGMNGVFCKKNAEFEVVETVVEVPAISHEDVANGLRVEFNEEVDQVKHVIAEEIEVEIQCTEQVDAGIRLESAKDEEMNGKSEVVLNESAELEFIHEENGKDECIGFKLESSEEEGPNQELELPHVENGGSKIQLESVEEEMTNQETQRRVNEFAELEVHPIENGNAGFPLESPEDERTNEETQMVVDEAADLEFSTLENGDVGIQLKSIEEERTNLELQSGANESAELELPPVENGEDHCADQPDGEIHLESEEEEMTQVDAGIGLESAKDEEVNQKSKVVFTLNESAESEFIHEEKGKDECIGIQLESSEEEGPNQDLELPHVENGGSEIQLESVEEEMTYQETQRMVNESAELELHPIESGDAGFPLESLEDERTNEETQMVVDEAAELDFPILENGDAGIQLESTEEERTNLELQTVANESAELELPLIENREDHCADQPDSELHLESEEEEMTQESPTVVYKVPELELPSVENAKETEMFNSRHEIKGEIDNKDVELQMKSGVDYSGETVEANTCPAEDTNLDSKSVCKEDCLAEESGYTGCSKDTSVSVIDAVDVETEGDGSIHGKDVDGEDDEPLCEEVVGSEKIHKDGILLSATTNPSTSISPAQLGVVGVPVDTSASDGQKAEDTDVGKKHYLIAIPRHIDNKIRSQIRLAQLEVDEKTRARDSLNAELKMKRVTRDEYQEKFEAAVADERAAKAAADAKRQEMASVQLMINRMKDAASIDEIGAKIHRMEHMIAHETMPLKEEKRLIHEIKQLKVACEQICATIGKESEVQEVYDQRDTIEQRLKVLKQEFGNLRNEVFRAEGVTKDHKKKRSDALENFKEAYREWLAVDKLRQEAYTKLQNLRKQAYERNKLFYQYKEDQEKAHGYASTKEREALQCHCSKQVERIMELWNKNEEFRKQYVNDNLRSTVWRFKTLDGRSLAPDEKPAVFMNPVEEQIDIAPPHSGNNAPVPVSAPENPQEKADASKARPTAESTARKSSSAKPEKLNKPIIAATGIATVSSRKEEEEKENERRKEEEELLRKAEVLRKEEATAKLKEQHRLEQIAKAKEAEERKKRNAEKANARAEVRAQREAELREKQREKRARKNEKKRAAATSSVIEQESASTLDNNAPDITAESETEQKAKASMPSKRPVKPASRVVKQANSKPPVLPPRHRNKRKMQTWVWILVLIVAIVAVVSVSNGFTIKFSRSSFGF